MNKRNQSILNLLLFAGILLFVNILGSFFYTHLDLTEEKRYTLTDATKNLVGNLDDVVYVQVLLEGEFPAGFKRLQAATREMLDDLRSESGYVEYEFTDPSEGNAEQINARREQLAKDGIIPTNLRIADVAEGTAERIIYPYAIFNYKGRKFPVNLLENDMVGANPEVVLNNSIGLLEYKFANAIQKLQSTLKPAVVFTKGHGELNELQVRDFERTLRQYYDTGHIMLDSMTHIPTERVDALVVARPRGEFSDKDKFKIDQYVMNGGKVLWLIDRLNVNVDSINRNKKYVPFDYQLNLEDLWFKYGIRVQPNLILDLEASRIPLATGMIGNKPQFELFPYYYHPLISPRSKHPIVKSLDRVNLLFPSSIDTTVRVKTQMEKTVLLTSSQYSRLQFPPVTLDFEILRYPPQPEKFSKSYQPVAVLYEGVFPSLYANRVTEGMEAGLAQLNLEFKAESSPTRMIVVSDGDIIKNTVGRDEQVSPTGYNPFEKFAFANKDFLINAIEYLLDENGVIEARGKEVKLRLLDNVKAKAERSTWQLINIVLPLVFLALFGLGYNFLRRRRYAK